ncbi:YlcI/YnfO family protein [Pectobacterium carotovorum]|uniref:YlcI/YnfO family protein n=1 Tax=Pectobacterium carotovorum TaxID=554 RepID=UPI0013158BC0|nr:YlcI/YnfO family protein [Pectobacterium carotovorum]
MATANVNAKSKKMQARVPHEVVKGIEETILDGETAGQFIVTALQGEIKRRQRKQVRDTEPKD